MRLFSGMLLWLILMRAFPLVGQQPFPDSRFTQIGGLTLHHRSWMPTDSVRGQVLLVHGFCGSTFSWRHNIEALLGAGYRVVAVDVPPFGYSDRKRAVNHAPSYQAILLWGLLDSLYDSPTGWSLMGHSMGAAIIGAMAALRPHQTLGLICVDGTLMRARSAAGPRLRKVLASRYSQALVNVLARLYYFRPRKLRRFLWSAYASEPDEAALAGYRAPLLLRYTASGIFDLYAYAQPMFRYDETDVKAPVLIIWGDQDAWIPLETGAAFAQVLPQAEWVVFKGAGHCPMETHAPYFNEVVIHWLEAMAS